MLKTKTITTDKATILVVELPEGAHSIEIKEEEVFEGSKNERAYFSFPVFNVYDSGRISLPIGNWKLLGRLPDITEEQASELVNKIDNNNESYGFERFMSEKDFYRSDFVEACKTGLESLLSLLQSNDVYFENRELTWKTFDTEEKYKQSKSKVWDKERTFLFIKVD